MAEDNTFFSVNFNRDDPSSKAKHAYTFAPIRIDKSAHLLPSRHSSPSQSSPSSQTFQKHATYTRYSHLSRKTVITRLLVLCFSALTFLAGLYWLLASFPPVEDEVTEVRHTSESIRLPKSVAEVSGRQHFGTVP
jgi:hypothetical protein